MKSKLIPLLITLVLTLGSQTLLAQPGAGGGGGMGMGNPEARVAELIATLGITSQQEAAFREAMGKINEMQMSAMREMMASGGGAGMRMGAGQRGQAAAPADAPVDHSQHGGGMRMGAGQGGGDSYWEALDWRSSGRRTRAGGARRSQTGRGGAQ